MGYVSWLRLSCLCLACLLVAGCKTTVRRPNASPHPSGRDARVKVERAVGTRLENLEHRLVVQPQEQWSTIALEGQGQLVVLGLKAPGGAVRGEWTVKDGKMEPFNDFAEELDNLPEPASRDRLRALVPEAWLPHQVVASNSPPQAPSPLPSPSLRTPARATRGGSQTAASPATQAMRPRLIGVIAGDVNTAMVMLGHQRLTLTPGQSSHGVTLLSVTPRVALVRFHGQRLELAVEAPASTSRGPAPVQTTPPASQTEHVYLNNSSLDTVPPVQLKGGWRRFDTGSGR